MMVTIGVVMVVIEMKDGGLEDHITVHIKSRWFSASHPAVKTWP